VCSSCILPALRQKTIQMILTKLLKKVTIEARRRYMVVVQWLEWLYSGVENTVQVALGVGS